MKRNEPGKRSPRLHVFGTPQAYYWALSNEVSDALATKIDELLEAEPPATDIERLGRYTDRDACSISWHQR